MHLMNRRDLIRGFGLGAGATLLSPMLRELVREARGDAPAKRFLMLTGTWSYPTKYLTPPRAASDTDFDFPKSMAALEPLRRNTTLLTSLYAPGLASNGGHGMVASDLLTGTRSIVGCQGGCSDPVSITFDRYLARAMGANDRLSELYLSSADNPEGRRGSASYDGPGKSYPPVYDAAEAYKRAFMAGTPGAADVDPRLLLAQEKGVLDVVVADTVRAQKRLAGPERAKLERYLESLRALEQKLSLTATPVSCATGGPPAIAANALASAQALVDIAVNALACGVTHVAMVALSHEDYGPIGAPGFGTAADHVHEINHHDDPFLENIQAWRIGQTARAATRLQQLGLGDSSLTIYSDPNGGAHHGGYSSPMFMVLIGALGGALRTGRYATYPRITEPKPGVIQPAAGSRAINDVWVAIGKAFGLPLDQFGDPAHNRGPLPGLLA